MYVYLNNKIVEANSTNCENCLICIIKKIFHKISRLDFICDFIRSNYKTTYVEGK